MGLIHDFYQLFKTDPVVQQAILNGFFDERLYRGGWVGLTELGRIEFKKGRVRYILTRTNDPEFCLSRIAKGTKELLTIKMKSPHNPNSIDYSRRKFVSGAEVRLVNRDALKVARELLAKTQKDFGRV